MLLKINEGGAIEYIEKEPTLGTLQECVNGLIELVRITDEIDLFVNEEFLLIEPRPEVSLILKRSDDVCTISDEDLVVLGSCVFVGHNGGGESIGLNPEQIEYILERTNFIVYQSNKSETKTALMYEA